MSRFDITMEHTEESLTALSHMQYDLFCTRNYIARNLLSLVAIVIGAFNSSHFWGIALIAYGAYLMTSTYSASNHTVKKLTEAIKASGKGFPSSRYLFTEKGIEITFHPGKKDEEVTIPESVTKIGPYAFYECIYVRSVSLPSSLKTISSYAFCGCEGITSLTLPSTATDIQEHAFAHCTGLTSIMLPSGIETISKLEQP